MPAFGGTTGKANQKPVENLSLCINNVLSAYLKILLARLINPVVEAK